jgi:two-component system invasion response regulator UvrY
LFTGKFLSASKTRLMCMPNSVGTVCRGILGFDYLVRALNRQQTAHYLEGEFMIRILIADRHAIIRAGLREFLSTERDIEVTGEAAFGDDVLKKINTDIFDVVVLDIFLSGRNGIDTLKLIYKYHADLPVLVLLPFSEDLYAVNFFRAGARGCLQKNSGPDEFIRAIRTVSQRRRYVTPSVADSLINVFENPAQQPAHQKLSRREFQIFYKIANGQLLSEVADELFLSAKTISTYRARIMKKMKLTCNADITRYAINSKLI